LSGFGHCRVRSGLLSNRWCAALKSTCENQPSNNSNPLQKDGNPTIEGDYTLYERSVVAKNQKILANVYRDWGWEGWGVYGPMWVCGDWGGAGSGCSGRWWP
jgi:catalase (peroxidase I)